MGSSRGLVAAPPGGNFFPSTKELAHAAAC